MTAESAPVDWFALLIIAASALMMLFLARRAMRGLNQQDWILLRKARATGIDLKLPQSVSFMVFAATEAVGAELAEKMRREGFAIAAKPGQIQFARNRSKPGTPQDGWLVSGTRTLVIVPEALSAIRKTLTDMAIEHKALYLGWQLAQTVPALNTEAEPFAGSRTDNPAPAPERPPQ